MPLNREELRQIAAAKKKQQDMEDRQRQIEEERQRKEKIAECVKRCRRAMKQAAKEGKFYTEVDIENDIKTVVASEMSEFDPKFNGDGCGREVICLRWD